MEKHKKIRDVVYGFIDLDAQECEIIDHPAFQRLRRIKQLSLTDEVYPGANHTRFEHSIGVMQMATDMFNSIIAKNGRFLRDELFLDDASINIWRKKIRLAALLHDIGHAPFSHAGEDLMPLLPRGHILYVEGGEKRYSHEDYSIQIIKTVFRNIIEKHLLMQNYGIKAEDVTALIGDTSMKPGKLALLFKEIISGQLDADRADYLLRDSLHLGVLYGIYDRNRLVSCITIAKDDTGYSLAIEEKGWHIAESLVLARYQMFSQVYFHKVRRIYDYHIHNAVKEILTVNHFSDSCYPPPDNLSNINKYLSLDDWYMAGEIRAFHGGNHGTIILERKHYKCIYATSGNPSKKELRRIQSLAKTYNSKSKNFYLDDNASTTWYKLNKDITISKSDGTTHLSEISPIVKAMFENSKRQRFYVERDTM